MSNNEQFAEKNYIHEREFHIPEDHTKRALGEVALPGVLIDSKNVPFDGTPVARPGDIASRGAQHEPVPLGGIDEFPGNPERAINHPANIAKGDRDLAAMTGIVIRRDHTEE